MRLKRSNNYHDEPLPRLPLTAFIDVVLFLLLYFLLAGNLAETEAELASGLKADSQSTSTADLAPQVVSVKLAEGRAVFQLGTRTIADRPELVSVLKQLPKERGVFVKVSGQVPVAAAAAALQACRDAGFSKVNYVPAS